MKEIRLNFPKLYRYDRKEEICGAGIPFAQGEFKPGDDLEVLRGGEKVPSQMKVTSRYKDGSARYVFLRFAADLPANKGCHFTARVSEGGAKSAAMAAAKDHSGGGVFVRREGDMILAGNGADLEFAVKDGDESVFSYLNFGERHFSSSMFEGPLLKDGKGQLYNIKPGKWQVEDEGCLESIISCRGEYRRPSGSAGGQDPAFELKLYIRKNKPWVEVSFRLINSTDDALHVASLVFGIKRDENSIIDHNLSVRESIDRGDSKGEGSVSSGEPDLSADIIETTGTKYLDMISSKPGGFKVRTCVGSSNYKTNFAIADSRPVERVIDSKYLMGEANEHFIEVFYGTFFADVTDERGGVCATIYQAQQNYPKAIKADESGICVMLVPEGVEKVVMQPGMSREQRFLLHFHERDESLLELDNRSLIYQMPDRPWIDPQVFAKAQVMPDIFVGRDKIREDIERTFITKCDSHGRAYGMMNFGDCPDLHYTEQGRGKGNLVWSNNEYDYPHACALLYARTGERRFLDYVIAACRHWMDVDVCHYSSDPLLLGGQWEHTQGHCVEGCIVCSHEWVEGLLDMYHLTGEKRALDTALGIGENILRLLETPQYQVSGESNARETGWALRSLTALYVETGDERWVEKCEWIVGHFKEWTQEYGGWLSPYTDNTAIRVGFMISIAVGSLMRYYRVFPSKELKELMISAVDDLLENCYMANGVFFYKELPSLNRLNTNTLLLEALTIAWELTGDTSYLEAGRGTFESAVRQGMGGAPGKKVKYGDVVCEMKDGTKNFGQSFLPLSVYYKAMTDSGLLA